MLTPPQGGPPLAALHALSKFMAGTNATPSLRAPTAFFVLPHPKLEAVFLMETPKALSGLSYNFSLSE